MHGSSSFVQRKTPSLPVIATLQTLCTLTQGGLAAVAGAGDGLLAGWAGLGGRVARQRAWVLAGAACHLARQAALHARLGLWVVAARLADVVATGQWPAAALLARKWRCAAAGQGHSGVPADAADRHGHCAGRAGGEVAAWRARQAGQQPVCLCCCRLRRWQLLLLRRTLLAAGTTLGWAHRGGWRRRGCVLGHHWGRWVMAHLLPACMPAGQRSAAAIRAGRAGAKVAAVGRQRRCMAAQPRHWAGVAAPRRLGRRLPPAWHAAQVAAKWRLVEGKQGKGSAAQTRSLHCVSRAGSR